MQPISWLFAKPDGVDVACEHPNRAPSSLGHVTGPGQQDWNSEYAHPNRVQISLCNSSELGQRDRNREHANAIRTPLSLNHVIARFQSVERQNARHQYRKNSGRDLMYHVVTGCANHAYNVSFFLLS